MILKKLYSKYCQKLALTIMLIIWEKSLKKLLYFM